MKTTGDEKAENNRPLGRAQKMVHQPIDVEITWLLRQLAGEQFRISRDEAKCRTPQRNPDTEAALDFFKKLGLWAYEVSHFFVVNLMSVQTPADSAIEMSAATDETGLFVPVLPFFEKTSKQATAADDPQTKKDSKTKTG